MSADEALFLSTSPGLEAVLADEARRLPGAIDVEAEPGGVSLRGPAGLHQDACLQLRTANHVLLRLGRFESVTPDAVVRGLRAVKMAPFSPHGVPPRIAATSRHSRVRAGELESLAWDAWGSPGKSSRVAGLIQLRNEQDVCTVSVDCSGEILHKRGYRQEVSRAPLRETIAAGMLQLAGYDGSGPLWDPMCGSGTVPIEAALVARRFAPGRLRRFAFQAWPTFAAAAWDARLARARAEEQPQAPAPILGTDLNAGSLGVARRNGRRAEVAEQLTLERLDATALEPTPALASRIGWVVSNLPYGIRVGEGQALEILYAGFGEALRRALPGWKVALLSADERLDAALGLRFDAVHPLDNGGIRCRLLLATLGR